MANRFSEVHVMSRSSRSGTFPLLVVGLACLSLAQGDLSAHGRRSGETVLERDGAKPVTAIEIEALLGSDNPFEYEFEIGTTYSGVVQYQPDGAASLEWNMGGRKGSSKGRWRMHGIRICHTWNPPVPIPIVGPSGNEICHVLYKRKDGSYAVGSGQTLEIAVWKVKKFSRRD